MLRPLLNALRMLTHLSPKNLRAAEMFTREIWDLHPSYGEQNLWGVAGAGLAIIEWFLGLGDGIWGSLFYSVYVP